MRRRCSPNELVRGAKHRYRFEYPPYVCLPRATCKRCGLQLRMRLTSDSMELEWYVSRGSFTDAK